MKFLLTFAFLILASPNNLVHSKIETDVLYNDLENLNEYCSYKNVCQVDRVKDTLQIYACNCDSSCSQRDTCCMDSVYRDLSTPIEGLNCRAIFNTHGTSTSYTKYDKYLNQGKYTTYFMVDQCPGEADATLKNLCRDEWNGDEDVRRLVPVTSLSTFITYKNDFCFRCHETTEEFKYWDIEILDKNSPAESEEKAQVELKYNSVNKTWMAPLGKDGSAIPVNWRLTIPEKIRSVPKKCEPNVISRCADTWTDESTRAKCNAYMFIVLVEKADTLLTYRNPHCALCNFENWSNMKCKRSGTLRSGIFRRDISTTAKILSFRHLIHINASEGSRVGEIQKCQENYLWNPFSRTCHRLNCALPGYVIKNGRCAPS